MHEANISIPEWMASEIILTEPILRPVMSFAAVRNAFESIDRRAAFCLAVFSDKIAVLLLNGSTQKVFACHAQKKRGGAELFSQHFIDRNGGIFRGPHCEDHGGRSSCDIPAGIDFGDARFAQTVHGDTAVSVFW